MLPIIAPLPIYLDLDGDALDDGSVYYGVANANPVTSPVPVFWDLAGTQPAAQPIKVLSGYPVHFGTPANLYTNSFYSISVYNKKGRLVLYIPDSSQYDRLPSFITDLSSTSDLSKGVSLVGGAQRIVKTIADLRLCPKTGTPQVYVMGYYAQGDGGGGSYYYDATDTTSPDNNGTLIVAADGGRWRLALIDSVTVLQFGAKGDGTTDDVAAFQGAMNWCATQGGGIVQVPVKAYFFGTGSALQIPGKVTLKGMAQGPFGGSSTPPTGLWGPTMLVTNIGTPFIQMTGYSGKVMDLLFHYPNQVLPSAPTPTAYPATIKVNAPWNDCMVSGITIINGYIGIDIQAGRTRVQSCTLGCFFRDIMVDQAVDWVVIRDVHFQVMWNVFITPFVYPAAIDTWVLNNGIALVTGRVDSLVVSDCGMFSRYCFHQASDSALAIAPKNGYGRFTNIDIDTCAYGVLASSAAVPGFRYTNVDFGANGGVGTPGQWAAQTLAGGTLAPVLTFSNGSIRGAWASGGNFPFSFVAAGQIYTTDIRGMQPAGNVVVTPAFPATTVGVKNPYTFPLLISVGGGTITTLAVASVNIQPVAGSFVLPPGKTVAFAYTGTPGWSWVGI